MQFWNSKNSKFADWSQSAFADQLFWLFLVSWGLPLLASVVYISLNFNQLPWEIPLFYSRLWGESQLARNVYIYLPPAGVFLLGIFDLGLAISFHPRDRVFAYLLGGTAALMAVLTLVTTVSIVNLLK